jgi:hypothetical protein
MKRLHLFEFEDQPWFPRIVRDGMTDYLKFVANRFDFYKSVIPILAKGLQKVVARRLSTWPLEGVAVGRN